MRTPPSTLTPFLRSDAQGALLAELFLDPEHESTISDLARAADVSQSVAHREATRLIEDGVVADRIVGRNRMVHANTDHPLYPLMRDLVAATYGPIPVLRSLLNGIPGIHEAYVYGSWAERRSGRPGHFPHDVDVLVVGDVDRADTVEAGITARQITGCEINIHVVTPQAWAEPTSVFLQHVRSQPLISLTDQEIHP
ncbi:MAG: winged helix-turn-helix domain-containing protein [Propionibacteriaceae bacterium]|jgi:DNA-binding transcriptional ArsR family regulator|nr:winged helix-turn-helix domain-containing protein [Propionibacteriaceae bacterium]